MTHEVTLLMTSFVTHDVKRFVVERPSGFHPVPGQGVELSIAEEGWRDQQRPFTPTSRIEDRALEFTIKEYRDHHGVTEKLHSLKPGARLLISDPWGTITYHGPGVFIAGGAGITPLIAIIRQLADEGRLEGHRLIYSNKTPADIIYEPELRHLFGDRLLCLCTRSPGPGCENRRIDKEFLAAVIANFDQHFYLCGPRPFVKDIRRVLTELGATPDALVFER